MSDFEVRLIGGEYVVYSREIKPPFPIKSFADEKTAGAFVKEMEAEKALSLIRTKDLLVAKENDSE